MASTKSKALTLLKPSQFYLGRYHSAERLIGGKHILVSKRDGWRTGELFQDATGRRTYEVQFNGSLKRV